MSAKAVMTMIGGILLLAGFILGFVPQSASGVSCGSALHGNNQANVDDLTRAMMADSGYGDDDDVSASADACNDRRSTYQPIVWTLIAVGGALLLVGLYLPGKETVPA